MKSFVKNNALGFSLALATAVAAYWLGKLVPVVGGPVFGLLLGILTASFWKLPGAAGKGLKFTSKYILQAGVILLGFEMNMASVVRVGQESLLVILVTLSVAFLTAYLVGKSLQLSRKLTMLIGVGTAICGGSAIAAVSSAVDAEDQDISYSISTIFLFNLAAVFLFPALGHLLNLTDTGFGMWAGTAINDTSSVVAAGYAYSEAAGSFATIVKLTRSLMIVPVTLLLAVLFARAGKNSKHFSFARVFPWFVLGFLVAALLRSLAIIPADAAANLVWGGKFLIVTAMAAIGLNTNIRLFVKAGPRALVLGAMTWVAVMSSSLAIQYFTQAW